MSFLKTRKNMEVLRQIHFQALEPPMIEALITHFQAEKLKEQSAVLA